MSVIYQEGDEEEEEEEIRRKRKKEEVTICRCSDWSTGSDVNDVMTQETIESELHICTNPRRDSLTTNASNCAGLIVAENSSRFSDVCQS